MLSVSSADLVRHLIETGVLRTQNIIEAFEKIDRADFVLDASALDVYGDYPLPIGYHQTISQPTTVAMMMEMLEPCYGEKILDIGSGSGWTTALLASIVGEKGCVTGLERLDELVEFGRHNFHKYKFNNAKIIPSGNKLGIENEKFDRILVSAAAEELPHDLIKQLNIGGKLVIPVRDSIYEITRKDEHNIQNIKHYGFTFVPLIY